MFLVFLVTIIIIFDVENVRDLHMCSGPWTMDHVMDHGPVSRPGYGPGTIFIKNFLNTFET